MLLNENKARAARFGIQGKLIDFSRSEEVPYTELLEELLAFVEAPEHLRVARSTGSGLRVDERVVPLPIERLEHRPACTRPLPLERAQQTAGRRTIAGVEGGRCASKPCEEDVKIADIAEDGAEPLQLERQLLRVGRDERGARAQQRSRTPDGDAHVVEALGIGAEPRARIVRENLVELLAEQAAEPFERGLRWHGRLEREHAEELRRQVARMSSGALELLRDATKPRRFALAQLDLELDELRGDPLRIHHGDLVDRHLGGDTVARDE